MRALGLMSETSLDGVDLAVIETDGIEFFALGPAGEYRLPDGLRQQCMAATLAARDWTAGPEPDLLRSIGLAVAEFQAEAALDFLRSRDLTRADLDGAGFYGQTLLHVPPASGRPGRSLQIGDPHVLAGRIGVPVVYDLRQADLAAGGQGAPLAPIHHVALVRRSDLTGPTAVLNLGGVANLTFVDGDTPLVAFDAGPANGPLDQWVERHGRGRNDEDGRISGSGRVDEDRIASWLSDPLYLELWAQVSGPLRLWHRARRGHGDRGWSRDSRRLLGRLRRPRPGPGPRTFGSSYRLRRRAAQCDAHGRTQEAGPRRRSEGGRGGLARRHDRGGSLGLSGGKERDGTPDPLSGHHGGSGTPGGRPTDGDPCCLSRHPGSIFANTLQPPV